MRGARAVAIVVLAAAVAAVAWAILQPDGGAETPPAPGVPARPAGAVALIVLHVLDGDTFEARMLEQSDLAQSDLAQRGVVTTPTPMRVRLIGIDAPEGTPAPECGADEARSHLRELLPEGAVVWAAPDTEPWDRYGRDLLDVWTDDGRFVNHELVAAGDAEAMPIRPNTAYAGLLASAQSEAQAAGRGRWGACG